MTTHMVMSQATVRSLVRDELLPAWKREKVRLDRIDLWYRWDHENPKLPRDATPERKALLELAKTPWLALVVSNVAQNMYVDGYASPDGARSTEGPWETWNWNQFDGRQIAVHRAALAYGQSYVTVLPGEGSDGRRRASMRGVSPRKMLAVYADVAEDEWPMYALRVESSRDAYALRVYDEDAVYYLSASPEGDEVEFISYDVHGVGVCPVSRYANVDLEGRDAGQVEPYISDAARIEKTNFDRLLTQHYNSWKIRYISGLDLGTDEEVANRKKMKLAQEDFLVLELSEMAAGSLPETSIDGFIRAHESDVKSLAAATQTPTHALTGDLINLSADALAAARAELKHKVTEIRTAYGACHDRTLRLAAHVEGDAAAAEDFMSHVTWQDTEVRSWSQAVDALGKAAQMLEVPVEALWSRIPGTTKLDVDEWKKLARRRDAQAAVAALRDRAQAAQQDDTVRDLTGRGDAPAA